MDQIGIEHNFENGNNDLVVKCNFAGKKGQNASNMIQLII